MDRHSASKLLRQTLDQYGLKEWGVRLTTNVNDPFLGLCSHKDKCIILNAHHVDMHPDNEIRDTILHEVAHAIVGPFNGHGIVWQEKAVELGAEPKACSHLDLPEHIIDAIRSGATVEYTEETETRIIKKPSYKVTRLQDKCPECGKVAIEKFAIDTVDKEGNQVKLITLDCFHIIKKVIPRATPFETIVSNDWKLAVKSCKHKWERNQCNECGEFKLFNFQVIGARFAEVALASQKGCGIFDDMGLGKTVQGLAVLRFHMEKYGPVLYVVKSAITFNWFKEIVRWLGPDKLGQIIKTGRDTLLPGLKSYIISADMLRRFPLEKLKAIGIKLVIVDECQAFKNPDSARTQALRKIVSMEPTIKLIALSGTPWKNRGAEFFAILNMLDPIKFWSYQNFLDTWVEYYWHGNKRKMGGIKNPAKFREFTANLIIRREYNEVMDEYPDINRMKLNVQLDELQQNTYDDSVSEFVSWYNNAVIGGEEENLNSIEILAKMARMRHITGLAKIPATLGFIEEFIDNTDKKLVVFVHHKDVGQLMFDALRDCNQKTNPDYYELAQTIKDNGIDVVKLTAEFKDSERFEIEQAFNKSKRSIMIASTLASGEGINLQTCADCVMHERQWNPQNEDQAFPGRFRRIGQLAKVLNGTYVEAEDTIDYDLDVIVAEKRRRFHAVMNKSEMPTWNESDIAHELAATIVRKHKEKNKHKVKSEVSLTNWTSYRA